MTVRNFSQLSEMLDSKKVKFKMTKQTHKYIIGIGGSIDPEKIMDSSLPNKFQGIAVVYDSSKTDKQVEFVPTFTPRIGNGFEINLD
jgi:triosephosphate isomerase